MNSTFRRLHRFRRNGRRGVSEAIGTALLVVVTVILVALVYFLRFPLTPAPPTVQYEALTGASRPVWGDPTDCHPGLPNPTSYYLGAHKSTSLYNTYMNAWWSQCEYGTTGTYNSMNVTAVQITSVSTPIPLKYVTFQFVCTNQTPTYVQTILVQGPLSAMEWEPGSSQTLNSSAPTLGYCATYNANGAGGGANSVYYNRLGYFDPVDFKKTSLQPPQTIIIYIHTPNSVLEAPSPIEPVSTWNLTDTDDYHGAPPWCFDTVGACTINLIDTQWTPNVLLVSIPLYLL